MAAAGLSNSAMATIAAVRAGTLRRMPLRAVANPALDGAVFRREQLLLRAKDAPHLGEHSM